MRKLLLGITALAVGGLMAAPAFADPPGCPPVITGNNTMFMVDSLGLDKDVGIAIGLSMREGVGEIIMIQTQRDPWPGIMKQLGASLNDKSVKPEGGDGRANQRPEGAISTAQKKPVIPLNNRRIAEVAFHDNIKDQVGPIAGFQHGAEQMLFGSIDTKTS